MRPEKKERHRCAGDDSRAQARHQPAQSGPSEVAKGACLYRIGTEADIVESTAVKPGAWRIVMKTKAGGQTAICTVTNDGKVTNWVPAK